MKWILPAAFMLAALLVSGCVTETGKIAAGSLCPPEGPCCGNDMCEPGEEPGSCPDDCVCMPGEMRCHGERLMDCADTGRYWVVRESCGGGCENGRCVSVYYSGRSGLSMGYPEGWRVIDGYSMMGVNYTAGFFGPREGGFEPSILIKTEPSGYGLEEYARASEEALSRDFSGDDYRLIGEGPVEISGLEARFITYSLNYTGIPLKGRQVFVRDRGYFHVIIYTALQGMFDGQLFDGVIRSFRSEEARLFV